VVGLVGGDGTTTTLRARALTQVARTRASPIRSIVSANIPAVVPLAARRVLLLLARRLRVPGTKIENDGGDGRA